MESAYIRELAASFLSAQVMIGLAILEPAEIIEALLEAGGIV